jgi:hypothetical protein
MTTAPNRLSPTGRNARTGMHSRVSPLTADSSRGATNLLTVPRAGNMSTDTRAGLLRRSRR